MYSFDYSSYGCAPTAWRMQSNAAHPSSCNVVIEYTGDNFVAMEEDQNHSNTLRLDCCFRNLYAL